MDSDSKVVEDACLDMLKSGQRQMRYRLKEKYFNGIPANQVRTTSPISSMSGQWLEKVGGEVVSPKSQGICNIAPLAPSIQFILGDYPARCCMNSCSVAWN
jgi:hypothetical protein